MSKKMKRLMSCSVSVLACLVLGSCDSADPSATRENQKALAEATSKASRLEEELSNLKSELEETKARLAQAQSAKLPTRADVEESLDKEVSKLKESARREFVGARVKSFSTWDLDIPSFDKPFSCKAKMEIDSEGKPRMLYWVGTANLKGEWNFEKADNLEPQQPTSPSLVDVADPSQPSAPRDGVIAPAPQIREDPPSPDPEPPEKPKYDINFDHPIMGPGAR